MSHPWTCPTLRSSNMGRMLVGSSGGGARPRLLISGGENCLGIRAELLCRAHRPVDAFGNLTGVLPTHAAINFRERSQQVTVVFANLDGREQQQGPIAGEGAPTDSRSARQL